MRCSGLEESSHNSCCPWQVILAGSSLGTRTPLPTDVWGERYDDGERTGSVAGRIRCHKAEMVNQQGS